MNLAPVRDLHACCPFPREPCEQLIAASVMCCDDVEAPCCQHAMPDGSLNLHYVSNLALAGVVESVHMTQIKECPAGNHRRCARWQARFLSSIGGSAEGAQVVRSQEDDLQVPRMNQCRMILATTFE